MFLIGCQDVYGLGIQGPIFSEVGDTLALEEANTNRIQCDWVRTNQQSLVF
jgi:hypothetical protein